VHSKFWSVLLGLKTGNGGLDFSWRVFRWQRCRIIALMTFKSHSCSPCWTDRKKIHQQVL
jgi:hypothetical protein